MMSPQPAVNGGPKPLRGKRHDFDAILPTVIQIQALLAANEAGFQVPEGIINAARNYLNMKLEKHESAKVARAAAWLSIRRPFSPAA